MNPRLLLAPLALGLGLPLVAQPATQPPPTPPPVSQAFPGTPGTRLPAGEQRIYTSAAAETLVARETAEGVVENFRKAYVPAAAAAPRIVVYVNRALVDTTASGLRLTARTERFEKDGASTKTSGENTYAVKDAAAPAPALADQQTVREVERLFGRVFRAAGAQLADQKVAATLLPDDGSHLTGEQGAKDRTALAGVADIAIEILISSRNLTVPEISGDVTYSVPDIQATAIRLKDAAIVGQAAASDIVGKGVQAGRVARQFDVRDITEATAIALMEDMLTGKTSAAVAK